MFLTTNRAETLDSAFHSRIHLSISYPPLSSTAIREVWKNGIIRGCAGRQPRWLTRKFLDGLTKSKVNGREIKNIVSMAYALARHGKREMWPADIFQGLEALKVFEADFNHELAQRKRNEASNASNLAV